jgi:hypothetical protein
MLLRCDCSLTSGGYCLIAHERDRGQRLGQALRRAGGGSRRELRGFIRNADAAPAVLTVAILPLTFISGIWFTTDNQPAWLRHIAAVFPVHALADALQYAFNPHTTGSGIRGADVRTMAIWLAVGIVLMLRFLRQPLGEK